MHRAVDERQIEILEIVNIVETVLLSARIQRGVTGAASIMPPIIALYRSDWLPPMGRMVTSAALRLFFLSRAFISRSSKSPALETPMLFPLRSSSRLMSL